MSTFFRVFVFSWVLDLTKTGKLGIVLGLKYNKVTWSFIPYFWTDLMSTWTLLRAWSDTSSTTSSRLSSSRLRLWTGTSIGLSLGNTQLLRGNWVFTFTLLWHPASLQTLQQQGPHCWWMLWKICLSLYQHEECTHWKYKIWALSLVILW